MSKVAKSTEELARQIIAEMQKAVEETKSKSKEHMEEGTEYFYSRGPGDTYVRTGALGNTPKTTPVVTSANDVSFDAYLDKSHVYNSGDMPTMGQVLELANSGNAWRTQSGAWANPTVGRKHFWERTLKSIEKTFNKAMRKHFK